MVGQKYSGLYDNNVIIIIQLRDFCQRFKDTVFCQEKYQFDTIFV